MNPLPSIGSHGNIGRRLSLRASLIGSLAPIAFAVAPSWVSAQVWTSQATVQANVTATTNGTLAPSGEEQKDLISSLRPTFQLSTNGAGLKLKALVGADLVSYARGSQPDRVSPVVRADLNATLAERLLFLDSTIDAHQAELDPYGSRNGAGVAQNHRVSATYRVSPYLSREVSPRVSLLARYDETWTRADAEGLANQRFSKLQFAATVKPVPVGGTLELSRQDVRFSGSGDGRWTLEALKASGDVAVGGEFVVGPIVGQERTTLLLTEHTDTLYGAHLLWTPNQRTRVSTEVDHRFFGTGWDTTLQHRTPFTSLLVRWSRVPVTGPNSLGTAAAGSDLSSFLDAILTTRYPDPAARAALVNELISSRGLSTGVAGAIDVLADYAQLQTSFNTTLVFLGPRNSVSISVYEQTLRQLVRADDLAGSLFPAGADSRQTGATLGLNRKLSPQMSVDLTSTWSQIKGLADRAGDKTEEQKYRLAVIRSLSPRTGLSAGLQYSKLKTSVAEVAPYSATAAFIGLNHRF